MSRIKHEESILQPQRSYPGNAKQAAFLLGGISTGNVSIGSRGEFRDWEIFNRPGKGESLPNTFFSIWAKREGEAPVTKVLESKMNPAHDLSHGYNPCVNAGLPRLKGSSLYGEYPIAKISFEDDDLPVDVELEAYTPLIPLNLNDSSIPGAVLTYQVTNPGDRRVEATVCGSLVNPVGGILKNKFGNIKSSPTCSSINEYKEENGLSGLYMHSDYFAEDDLSYGNVSLTTTNSNTTYKRAWLRGAWFDYLQEFWDDFSEDGQLDDLNYSFPAGNREPDTGSLGVMVSLEPGESKQVRFFLTWYFPNRLNGWNQSVRVKDPSREIVQNYYVNNFDSSWSAAKYMEANYDRLDQETRTFRDTLFSSTLPNYVIDAISSNIPVIRSTTCFVLKDGSFYGYEGCFDESGCCPGTCTHVWNYAQTMAFLFPTLERSARLTEYLIETDTKGKMEFRAYKPFDAAFHWRDQTSPAAADGQLGTVMRAYREWKLSGDEEFLKQLWSSIKKTIQFAFIQWDTDNDYILDGEQHNTYDIEFYGPNPLTGSFLLGALKAGSEMAEHLGEAETAALYMNGFIKSRDRLEELTWNGEYYIQRLEDVDQYKYQHGDGCLSDQLLAQQLAHLYGLGYLLKPERVKTALRAIYKHNYRTDFANHPNCQRTFVLDDEQGLVLCSWPNGGRPKLPFVYSDEVWTGIEYHVATHLIYEGWIDEGLQIVKSVRDRHDGFKRNPWNEVECGHHYSRAMASWGLLIALSGFEYDMVKGEMSFDPKIQQDDFTTFWSTGLGWGTYSQKKVADNDYTIEVKVLYGESDMRGVRVHACGKIIEL